MEPIEFPEAVQLAPVRGVKVEWVKWEGLEARLTLERSGARIQRSLETRARSWRSERATRGPELCRTLRGRVLGAVVPNVPVSLSSESRLAWTSLALLEPAWPRLAHDPASSLTARRRDF